MRRKDGAKNEETMRIRMSSELLNRIRTAKGPYGWSEEADSSFTRHLIVLGLNISEQKIKEEQAYFQNRLEKAVKSEIIDKNKVKK